MLRRSTSLTSCGLLALAASAAALGAEAVLPKVVEALDAPNARIEGQPPLVLRATPGGDGAPSKSHVRIEAPALQDGQMSVAWLASVPVGELEGMEGVSFWISGADLPVNALVLLRPVGGDPPLAAAPAFVSRVHLGNPFWHRVVLPLSEFYDPGRQGTYPIPRFSVASAVAVEIGFAVKGETPAALTFSVDELGLTTWGEVRATLGWRSFMPPAHGFPLDLDRFIGPLRWAATGGATLDATDLQGFPHAGFSTGMAVSLPTPKASASRLLEPFAALAYYEGFCFWVKGDGADHVLRLSLTGADGRPFVFTTPVRGAQWKLVFAGFENFKIGSAPFEVEDAEHVRLSVALDPGTPAPARITLGPFRLGYEK